MTGSIRADVTVIGAGIVGCAIAHELATARLDVVLVDREVDVGFGTSKANSGIIHAGHHSSPDTLKGRLEWAGNRRWGPLAAELQISYREVGDLTVAFDDADVETLDQLAEQAHTKGVTGVEMWDAARVRAEEPHLTDEICAALHAPTAAVVNPYEACFALAEGAAINGTRLVLGAEVRSIDVHADGFTIATSGPTVHTRFVVNAAGLGADHVEAMVGLESFTLIARKGEEYLLDKRVRNLVHHIVFPCPTPTSKGILVIPTYDGTLMVGPTAHDVEDRDDLTTTTPGAREVFAAVQRLVPGLSAGDCIAEFAGIRAVTDTGDFVIGATPIPGFVNAAGIQSPGLTAAPAIAEMVRDELEREGLVIEPREPIVRRVPPPPPVRELDIEGRRALATDAPEFGRIVCRCELVTEGEVVDSIDRGATTLDGVKFRTRAGMGRCQGGFCTWRVMQLLAEHLGVPVSAITKRGGDSWMVVDRDAVQSEPTRGPAPTVAEAP
jgi:glycerol-3-phosphate dehydrogenase